MKTSTFLVLFSWVWLAIGVVGLLTDTDSALITGVVSSGVYLVGAQVAKLIEKKESK